MIHDPGGSSASVAARLVAWFASGRRDLPWRRNREPYTVVVSELMLQQTTVAAATPFYERFVARFPDWAALAAASEADVLAAWSGLGYYRRARSLHALAGAVMRAHAGVLPADTQALLALPGIGPYTAGAVLSFAFGECAAAIDGNAARVLSRHAGIAANLTSTRGRATLEALALDLMGTASPALFNEALIELGATTCTPCSPSCPACPLREDCRARIEGRIATLPPPPRRPASREVVAAAAWMERSGRVLLVRRSDDEPLLAGMWELPGGFCDRATPESYVRGQILPALGGGAIVAEIGLVRHVITNRRITLHVLRCTPGIAPRASATKRWLRPEEADSLAITGATRRALALVG